jgi:hypothetical protein
MPKKDSKLKLPPGGHRNSKLFQVRFPKNKVQFLRILYTKLARIPNAGHSSVPL